MYCVHCGCELPDVANFCLTCGASQKEPITKEKRTGYVHFSFSSAIDINLFTSEPEIVTFCKQQFVALGVRKKYSETCWAKGVESPGRYYFWTDMRLFNDQKMQILQNKIEHKLVTEGWVKDYNGLYIKEM